MQKEQTVTMPKTAAKVTELGGVRPQVLSDRQLDAVVRCLRQDLPGAVEYVERAARKSHEQGRFSYLATAPSELPSTNDWDMLVSRLARLFASPFAAIAHEWTKRQYGMAVAFVNCCIIAASPGEMDDDELWCLQSRTQLTPDC